MEIIAEIGQNHNGDMDLAFELIRQAKECGADVAKFQLYNARTLFPKEGNPWYEYNCKTELSREQIKQLARECERVGIEFMSSVFDVERIQWLEEVGMKRYKIASRSIYDQSLIEAVLTTSKPTIVSLGQWTKSTFPEIRSEGPLHYLFCISKYPTPLSDLHLSNVDFKKYAGFSDHTMGITAAQAAFARGARIVEKHFTLDKNLYGPDHSCSMTPEELQILSSYRNELRQIL